MLRIRLQRLGKRNDPFYRIVVIDKSKKGTATSLSILGTWHPKNNICQIDKKELSKWIEKGAKETPTVKKLVSK